jgi:methylated-DNA-[protein]-cysteine S-methyltransferase
MESSFSKQCYQLLKKVPKGKVVTYSDIAHALGCKAYRAVGTAMKSNLKISHFQMDTKNFSKNFFVKNSQNTNQVPCHRVINSDGKVGGYAWRPELKIEKLTKEGIIIKKGKIDLKKYRYSFF